ncbi:MAG TPA: cytochrome P460 family protein [Kofleriaceae bacterium]|nr:cytochrome P460 family protein [Kofleriaceae bacterium]
MRSRHSVGLVGVLLISLGLPAAAAAAGDASAGKSKSLACQACHVSSAGAAPRLAGQREAYIARQLEAFKAGDRKDPFMNAIAAQLGAADIANLAAFWSKQPPGSDTSESSAVAAIKKSHMVFPRSFPKGFTLYLTANDAKENVVSRTYVNTVGLQAARARKPLPDGSQIIVVKSAARLGPDKKPLVAKDGSWVTDKIAAYVGMESHAGWGKDIPELLRNANWNYAVFTAEKTPRAEIGQTICLACHKPKAAESYLFSSKELQAHALK